MIFEGVIEIRPFQNSDLAPLEEIFLRLRRTTFHWVAAEKFQRDDFLRETEGETILVAEIDGRPVGFISVWTSDHFVHHLYVAAEAKGRGVGTELLQRARDLSIASGAKVMRLKCAEWNRDACRFYERLGWSVESTAADETGPYRNYLLKLP